jgi:hypothetical protein
MKMKTMDFGSNDEPMVKKKSSTRNLKIALGMAAIILIPAIGSTLAGTITVGTGSVEFGQGTVATAACDNAITVTPNSTYSSGSAAFQLATIVLTNIDGTACNSKYFTIKVLNSSGTAQAISNGSSTTLCKVHFITATPSVAGDTCSGVMTGGNSTSTGFTITPTVANPLDTVNVGSITIESSTT